MKWADRYSVCSKKKPADWRVFFAKPDLARPDRLRNATLERNNARLRIGLQSARAIIDAQKNVCALLGLPSVEELP